MKKLLLIIFILATSIALKAQDQGTVLFNFYNGYSFDDKVSFDDTYTKIQGGYQWGGGFEFFARDNKSLELKYLRMATNFPLFTDAGVPISYGSDQGSLNYILFGGTNYFGKKEGAKVLPYAGIEAGLGLVSLGYTRWKFAWGGKLGMKIKTSSKVSLNLHGYFQSIIGAFGSDSWQAYPGVVVTTPDYAASFQIGVGGVLCFDITNL
jgi:hypothetical protein